MADARFPNLDEAFAFLDDARRRVEIELKCSILHDREISEEAVLEAEKGFGSIPGVPNPNHFKVAGHIAFWVRKLKPFRVFRISTVIHFLEERGIQHPFPPEMVRTEESGNPLHLFVNEMIAARAAFGIIRAHGTVLRPKPELVHDLITSLRYHSFSPSAIRIILEGMA